MTALLTIAALLTLLAVGALAGGLVRNGRRPAEPPSGPSWLEAQLGQRLLVQTADGQTIDGALARIDKTGLKLDAVRWTGVGQVDDTALAGSVWVPSSTITWIQRPELDHEHGTDQVHGAPA